MYSIRKSVSLLLVLCAMVLTGCQKPAQAPAVTPAAAETETIVAADQDVLGTGSTVCTVVVVDREGKEITLTLQSDRETLGAALQDVRLIAGEESDFGLYIETVNGITAIYEEDQTYWAIYVDGETSMVGVDQIPLTAGSTYMLKVETM